MPILNHPIDQDEMTTLRVYLDGLLPTSNLKKEDAKTKNITKPRNWIGKAEEKLLVGAMKKAKPWPLMLSNEERIPNTNETEKDVTVPLDWPKRSGAG
uniref:Uncharacterized protein n=1 Tax=Oryza punctata TaxID=4537 RepID=A0A0E0LGU7_ORYPU